MADIFLSYARADQANVEDLASALEQDGYSVWWDRHIDGGAEFSAHIERELEAAIAVIVAWSAESVASRWVRDEAGIALETGKLIAISLDGTAPPIGFKQIHAVDMTAPQGQANLQRALEHKLAREPVARLQTAEPVAMPRKKRTMVLAGIGAALIMLVVAVAFIRPGADSGLFANEEADVSIAVAILPFASTSDPDLEEFRSANSASLVNHFAGMENLTVSSPAATAAATGRNLTPEDLGEALNVDFLIEGELASSGENVTASLSLTDTDTGTTVWSRQVLGSKSNLGFFRRHIGLTLSSMLVTRLAEKRGDFDIPDGIGERGREAFLHGYEALNMRGIFNSGPIALRQFRVATSIAPDFADAHAGLAYILADSAPGDLAMSRAELEAEQKAANARALELDPDNVLARAASATAALLLYGDVAKALEISEQLVEQAPRNIFVQQTANIALGAAGRPREALTHIDQATAIDPLNQMSYWRRTSTLFMIGDYSTLKESARACPAPCGGAAWLWHGALIRTGSVSAYRSDIDDIIAMSDADPDSIPSHEMDKIARMFLLDEDVVIDPEDGIAEGFPFMQVLIRAGRIEDGFRVAMRNIEGRPTLDLLALLDGSRMTVPEAIRADPRYHAIFEIPRFKGIAEYRRAQGLIDGLPVFPMKPYEGS